MLLHTSDQIYELKREERLAGVGGQNCHGDRGREDELHDNEQPQHPAIGKEFLSGRRRNLRRMGVGIHVVAKTTHRVAVRP